MGRDRRRYPRVGVVLDVIVEAEGMIWRREPKSTALIFVELDRLRLRS